MVGFDIPRRLKPDFHEIVRGAQGGPRGTRHNPCRNFNVQRGRPVVFTPQKLLHGLVQTYPHSAVGQLPQDGGPPALRKAPPALLPEDSPTDPNETGGAPMPSTDAFELEPRLEEVEGVGACLADGVADPCQGYVLQKKGRVFQLCYDYYSFSPSAITSLSLSKKSKK